APSPAFTAAPRVPVPEKTPAPPPAKPMESAPDPASLDWPELRQAALQCRACGLCETRRTVVFGEGPTDAKLMFIGEGPGADEDAQGRPFVGRAGELLTRMITAMGFDRASEVYIANVVKCRPPGNRTPLPDEADACIGFLKRQIRLLSPKVIVTLGATPLLHLFRMKGITKIRGNWLDWEGIKVMPTYHPAFLLRDPNKKFDVWRDLQLVMKEFGKTPPVRRPRRGDNE
ncbi:MAG: uracil-DNA glycosylase, partial [Lentisphaeria bacterium]|nr:uracil-DNA glycosylase [Lentisphaeria bacterium]